MDDFTLPMYPRITLPGFDAPLAPPRAPVPDILDIPAKGRILRDPQTGRAAGGFTRTGTYLTVVR
jgi:hypothetical protein